MTAEEQLRIRAENQELDHVIQKAEGFFPGDRIYMFFCPGCKTHHWFRNKRSADSNHPCWNWNGSYVRPTVSPSILSNLGEGKVCHLYVQDGKIQYLSDSYHELRGQTVPMKVVD